MRISLGYDIALQVQAPTLLLGALHVHPSRQADLESPDSLSLEPALPHAMYQDAFGNRITRIHIPAGSGQIRLRNQAVIRDCGQPDPEPWHLPQWPLEALPDEALAYLLPSRYCDFDGELLAFAWQQFGHQPKGWALVRAISDYVHQRIAFDYGAARATRTATQAWHEGAGVCRDYAHLAVSLCRCMNIPARYVTGYLGDIGVPSVPLPMDFSAWFQVHLGGQWVNWDARHNAPRMGRVLMAVGRDAADVPITMVFGNHSLIHFKVFTDELAT